MEVSDAQSTHTVTRQRRITIAASAVVLLGGFNSGWIGPLLPTIAQAQSLSLLQVGWLVSASGAGSIAAMALSKLLIHALGARGCLQLGAALMSIGMGAISFGQGWWQLLASVIVLGLGMGASGVAASLCVVQASGPASAPALNRLHLFFGAGALSGPFLATAALSTSFLYSAAYLFGSALAALAALSLLDGSGSTARAETPLSGADHALYRSVILWLYALEMFLYVGIEAGITTWLFTYLRQAAHLDTLLASLSMSMLWSGLTASRLASVFLSSRVRPSLIITVAMALATVALAALTLAPALGPAILLVVALIGIGFGPIYPNSLAEANNHFRTSTSSVTPLVIACGALGGIAFPPLIGLILEKQGLQASVVALVASAVLMVVVFRLAKLRPAVIADAS